MLPLPSSSLSCWYKYSVVASTQEKFLQTSQVFTVRNALWDVELFIDPFYHEFLLLLFLWFDLASAAALSHKEHFAEASVQTLLPPTCRMWPP